MNYIRESFYRKVAEKRFGLDEAGPWDAVKTAGKVVGRFLPGAGAALGAYDAYDRIKKGDYTGAALSAGAGLSSFVPGVGTAASLGLTAAQLARDKKRTGSFLPSEEEKQAAVDKDNSTVAAASAEAKKLNAPPPPEAAKPNLPPGSNAAVADTGKPEQNFPSMSDTGNVEPATTPEKPSVTPRPAPSSVSTADTGGDDPREGGSGSGRNDTEYDRQKQSALASAKDTASAFGPGTQTTKPSEDETGGFGYDKPIDRSKPAAPQQSSVRPRPAPSPVSTADTGGDKYGSGNASAGFERGKYAAPDASDNSSGANELRSKQQAVDRGNLEESKSKYMNESTNFERFLRKNKYGKNT
jgi:hypothetical protein